jgi:hypothetical protein
MNLLAQLAQLNAYRTQLLDEFLPGFQTPDAVEGEPETRAQFIIGLVRNGIIILFIIVVIVAIVYAAIAGLKYIRSEGAADEIEEAQEAIKQVLIGVAVAFVGVILIIVINSIFAPNTDVTLAMRCFLGEFDVCADANEDGSGGSSSGSSGSTASDIDGDGFPDNMEGACSSLRVNTEDTLLPARSSAQSEIIEDWQENRVCPEDNIFE